MNRGEVWTLAGGPGFAGRPRPAVILQDELFAATRSVTVCPLTSDDTDARVVRPVIRASAENGLRTSSRLMVDKITTVARERLGRRVGRLSAADVSAMNRAVLVFLGLAGSSDA